MATRLRGAAPLLGAAILTGALAALLPPKGALVLLLALGLGLSAVLIAFRAGPGRAWHHPILMLLTGLAVLTVTWNGVPVANTAAADLVLLAALGALTFCWFQGSVSVPVPGWLVGAAAALLAAQLLAQLVVPVPPIDPPPSYTPPAPPLVTLAKVELGMLAVPILIGAVATSWRRVNLIVSLWLASATISAFIATVDSVTGAGIGLSITGHQLAPATRAAGLSLHPNHLALASTMALPLALLRTARPWGRGRATAIAATGLLLAGVMVSGSRIGLFAAVLAVGMTALLIARLRSRIVIAGLVAAAGILVLASVVPEVSSQLVGLDRLGGGIDAGAADSARAVQLQESLEIAMSHPLTGVGFTTILDAHNLPVQYWEAGGVLGILAMIVYVTGVFGTGSRLLRDRRLPAGTPELAGALMISFAVWVIAGLFQDQLGDRYIYIPVGLLLGLQVAARASRSERAPHEPATPAPLAAPRTADRAGIERVPVAS